MINPARFLRPASCVLILALITGIGVFLSACGDDPDPAPIAVPASAPIPAEAVSQFSGKQAFAHVKNLTDLGPRPPESEGYRQALAYLEKELAALGWKTTRQTFKAPTPVGPVEFTNLLARYSPNEDPDWTVSPPFLIGSHLDTKRIPGMLFLGANDSGSSTGVLVELARVLSAHGKAADNLELIFFDGEEAMLENITTRDGLYGSRYFAGQLNARKSKPKLGIVLDIVGDKNYPLLIGNDSHQNLQDHTRAASQKLGIDSWVRSHPNSIVDDHIPLINRANLPVLHLIGAFMHMPYWHQAGDTLDKVSPEALERTGRLTLQILHQLTADQ